MKFLDNARAKLAEKIAEQTENWEASHEGHEESKSTGGKLNKANAKMYEFIKNNSSR